MALLSFIPSQFDMRVYITHQYKDMYYIYKLSYVYFFHPNKP